MVAKLLIVADCAPLCLVAAESAEAELSADSGLAEEVCCREKLGCLEVADVSALNPLARALNLEASLAELKALGFGMLVKQILGSSHVAAIRGHCHPWGYWM